MRLEIGAGLHAAVGSLGDLPRELYAPAAIVLASAYGAAIWFQDADDREAFRAMWIIAYRYAGEFNFFAARRHAVLIRRDQPQTTLPESVGMGGLN